MAPRKTPADRIAILQDSLKKLQKHKTYKKLIKAIGETTDYVDGPEYEKQRPLQSKAYKAMIQGLIKK